MVFLAEVGFCGFIRNSHLDPRSPVADLPRAGEPIQKGDLWNLTTDYRLRFCPDRFYAFWKRIRTRWGFDARRSPALQSLCRELNLQREEGPIPPLSASIGGRA